METASVLREGRAAGHQVDRGSPGMLALLKNEIFFLLDDVGDATVGAVVF